MSRQVVLLNSHPVGEPKESDYLLSAQDLGELKDGLVRIETEYFSVDPYLRGLYSSHILIKHKQLVSHPSLR
jgi:NADPH-dependent curcumin reductase CurA